MKITALNQAKPRKIQGSKARGIKAPKENRPLDTVTLGEKKPMNRFFVEIACDVNVRGNVANRRDTRGVLFYSDKPDEDFTEKYEKLDAGVLDPKSKPTKYLMERVVQFYREVEKRSPHYIVLKNIRFLTDQQGEELSNRPLDKDRMTWDLYKVKLPDGKEGLDYINRANPKIRLLGKGEPTMYRPTKLNGKPLEY